MKNKQKVPVYLENAVKVVDRWMAYRRFFRRIPGIAVGIVYKDQLVFANGYGYSDIKTKKKVTPSTCFSIASNSKHFTAIAIMQLVEQGKLQLDDKVQKYLSWFQSPDKDINQITVRQLLSHSSGITRDGNTPFWVDDKFPTIDEVKKQFKEKVMFYSPLVRFKYSNFGYAILGEVIHIVSGKSYEQYMIEKIIKPLGMTATFPDLTREAEGKMSKGYYRDIPGKSRVDFAHMKTNAFASATGFISNVLDLAKFVSALFEGNMTLLSDASKREIQRVQWKRKEGENYGFGNEVWTMNNREIVGHTGGFTGFRTIVSLDKEQKIGVIILTNTNGVYPSSLAESIYHIIQYFKEHDFEYSPNKYKKEFDKYEGLFSTRWGDTEVVNIKGHLIGFYPEEDKPMGDHYRFEFIKDNEFKAENGNDFDYPGEKVRFVFDSSGKVVKFFEGPIPTIKDMIKYD